MGHSLSLPVHSRVLLLLPVNVDVKQTMHTVDAYLSKGPKAVVRWPR